MATYLVLLFPLVGFVGVGVLVRGIIRFEQRYHHSDLAAVDAVESDVNDVSELALR